MKDLIIGIVIGVMALTLIASKTIDSGIITFKPQKPSNTVVLHSNRDVSTRIIYYIERGYQVQHMSSAYGGSGSPRVTVIMVKY